MFETAKFQLKLPYDEFMNNFNRDLSQESERVNRSRFLSFLVGVMKREYPKWEIELELVRKPYYERQNSLELQNRKCTHFLSLCGTCRRPNCTMMYSFWVEDQPWNLTKPVVVNVDFSGKHNHQVCQNLDGCISYTF
jgi:hypothetical protein